MMSTLRRQTFGAAVSVLRQRRALYSKIFHHQIPKQSQERNEEVFFPQNYNNGIRDKTALVTGGGDGVGLRCVRELLRCGAKAVMIADTNERWGYKVVREFCKEYSHDRVAFIRINSASGVLLRNAFLSTIKYFKGLDIVINNVKFKERRSWEEQVDEYIKGIVLSTKLSLEYMGRQNGGAGGTLVNIISSFEESSDSCPLFLATQEFVVGFDRQIATGRYDHSDVKVLTICQATLESVGCDLETVINKGKNGCVWTPS